MNFLRPATYTPSAVSSSRALVRAAGQAVTPTPEPTPVAPTGPDMLTGLLALAVSVGVVYAGAYFGAKAAHKK